MSWWDICAGVTYVLVRYLSGVTYVRMWYMSRWYLCLGLTCIRVTHIMSCEFLWSVAKQVECQLARKMLVNLREKEVAHNTQDKCHVARDRKLWSKGLMTYFDISWYKAIKINILQCRCWRSWVQLKGIFKYYISILL